MLSNEYKAEASKSVKEGHAKKPMAGRVKDKNMFIWREASPCKLN